ncbi:hypothetical protein LWI29_011408 [Acer saccharum]|uniref:Uncharacterized protein n=1 Tax=Acer saccharum TaxID=4024 RepID=A0AA39VGF6_ACESA|nr:hypothetical protein LWI29_011408 [Acer saccharum]
MKNPLPQRLVAGERNPRTASWEFQDGGRVKNGVAGEIRRLGDFDLPSFTDFGKCIEEVPERSSVSDGMIDRTADEDTVGELGDLYGGEGFGVAGVADGPVESEEFFKAVMYVLEIWENVVDVQVMISFGLNEFDAGVVAEDSDMAIRVCVEATGEGGEVAESGGERGFEVGNEVRKGGGGRWLG